jgi:hypothetical protein
MLADVIEAAELEGSHDEGGCVGLKVDRPLARLIVGGCRVERYRYDRLRVPIFLEA